jgi:hypothetical protein
MKRVLLLLHRHLEDECIRCLVCDTRSKGLISNEIRPCVIGFTLCPNVKRSVLHGAPGEHPLFVVT